jgi:hypothetical protein
MLKPQNRAILARNKQLVLLMLLSTRSAYRGMLEGVPPGGGTADRPKCPKDIVNRAKANLPPGLVVKDIDTVFLDELFVPPNFSGAAEAPDQINNITTDIKKIMTAVDIDYDPAIPDCPKGSEVPKLCKAILKAIK